MVFLSGLIDPQQLRQLSDRDIDIVTGLIEGELSRNPEIQAILRERIDPFLGTEQKGPERGKGRPGPERSKED